MRRQERGVNLSCQQQVEDEPMVPACGEGFENLLTEARVQERARRHPRSGIGG